jgi:hypothetical protein
MLPACRSRQPPSRRIRIHILRPAMTTRTLPTATKRTNLQPPARTLQTSMEPIRRRPGQAQEIRPRRQERPRTAEQALRRRRARPVPALARPASRRPQTDSVQVRQQRRVRLRAGPVWARALAVSARSRQPGSDLAASCRLVKRQTALAVRRCRLRPLALGSDWLPKPHLHRGRGPRLPPRQRLSEARTASNRRNQPWHQPPKPVVFRGRLGESAPACTARRRPDGIRRTINLTWCRHCETLVRPGRRFA